MRSRYVIAGKLPHHPVISSAAAAASAELRDGDLKDRTGIIAHAAHKRCVKYHLKIRALGCRDTVDDLLQPLRHVRLQHTA